MKKKYDWNALKCEYVTGDISAAALAKKYSINKQTLYRHYQIERWSELRKEYLSGVMEKCADKAAYIAAMRLSKEMDIAGRLSDILQEAADDKKQFNRYLVREKNADGETSTEEKIFEKLDMQSLNGAIKALSSLENIRRVMCDVISPAQERRLNILEKKANGTDEKEKSGGGVVILPEVED